MNEKSPHLHLCHACKKNKTTKYYCRNCHRFRKVLDYATGLIKSESTDEKLSEMHKMRTSFGGCLS